MRAFHWWVSLQKLVFDLRTDSFCSPVLCSSFPFLCCIHEPAPKIWKEKTTVRKKIFTINFFTYLNIFPFGEQNAVQFSESCGTRFAFLRHVHCQSLGTLLVSKFLHIISNVQLSETYNQKVEGQLTVSV